MIIAIDGPAASGKGTLGKRLATHYGLRHLDTGLIYRAVAKALIDAGLSPNDAAAAAQRLAAVEVQEAVAAAVPQAQRAVERQTIADRDAIAVQYLPVAFDRHAVQRATTQCEQRSHSDINRASLNSSIESETAQTG